MQEASNLSAALERSETYLAADPGNEHLLAQVIDQSLAIGAPARARQHCETALAMRPDDPFFQARMGSILLAEQRWADAYRHFDALYARFPDVNLAYNQAFAARRMQQHADVVRILLPFARRDDAPAALLTLLLRAIHHTGDLDEALLLARQWEERLVSNADFLAASALVHFDAGHSEESARLGRAALSLGARPLEALVVSASLALADTDADQARTLFAEALQFSPRDGRSWSGLGMASMLRRDWVQAEEELCQALECMPDHIGSWIALAWCRIAAGKLVEAGAAVESAIALDRNFAESHGCAAVVAAMNGARATAQAAIERALRLDVDSLSARYAEMLLSGQANDPALMRRVALGLIRNNRSAQADSVRKVLGGGSDA